jgi:ABC-type multidrug transport system fused ATPase/permease subunit
MEDEREKPRPLQPGVSGERSDLRSLAPEVSGDRDDLRPLELEVSDEPPTLERPVTTPQPSTPRSRVWIREQDEPRPAPPPGSSDEDYRWHSYRHHPSGRPDAVEFIDTYKRFGSTQVLRGLNMGLPEGMVSIIIGPSGTGKSV